MILVFDRILQNSQSFSFSSVFNSWSFEILRNQDFQVSLNLVPPIFVRGVRVSVHRCEQKQVPETFRSLYTRGEFGFLSISGVYIIFLSPFAYLNYSNSWVIRIKYLIRTFFSIVPSIKKERSRVVRDQIQMYGVVLFVSIPLSCGLRSVPRRHMCDTLEPKGQFSSSFLFV